MSPLVFVPLTAGRLRTWATAGGVQEAFGYGTTPAMLAAFGFAGIDEDAEHTALCIASLDGLLTNGVRLVAVVDAPGEPVDGDTGFGRVRLTATPWSAVTALFSEGSEPAVVQLVATQIAGLGLEEAWDNDDVQALLADGDLLWYGPGEWRALVRG